MELLKKTTANRPGLLEHIFIPNVWLVLLHNRGFCSNPSDKKAINPIPGGYLKVP
jgi:hypothetical protein